MLCERDALRFLHNVLIPINGTLAINSFLLVHHISVKCTAFIYTMTKSLTRGLTLHSIPCIAL